jgi:hypothetical protein
VVAGKQPELPGDVDEDQPPYDPRSARHAGHLDLARELLDGKVRLGGR